MTGEVACNIDRVGQNARFKAALVLFALGIFLTIYCNIYLSNEFWNRIILFPVFQAASITYLQIPAKTCILNAALGIEEENSKQKKIKSEDRVLSLRIKGFGILFKGFAIGFALALFGFIPFRLKIDCNASDATCSVFYL